MIFSAVKFCEEEDRHHDDVITQTPSTDGLSSPLQALLMTSDSPSSIALPPPTTAVSSLTIPSPSSLLPPGPSPPTSSVAPPPVAAVAGPSGQGPSVIPGKCPEDEKSDFLEKLSNYMTETGQNFAYIPIFDHKELDLWRLYKCVTARGGLQKVVDNKKWQEVIRDLGINKGRTDASYRLKTHYEKCLLPYEKAFFKGNDDIPSSNSSSQSQSQSIVTSSGGLPQITMSQDGGVSEHMGLVGKRKRIPTSLTCENGHICDEIKKPDDKRMCRELMRVWDDESLFKYAEWFGLEVSDGDEMVSVVSDHFVNQRVDEEFVINQFLDSFNK